MPKTIKIAGRALEVSAPYEAGHVVTAAEARALNQMRAENIGNQFRKRFKDAGADETKLGAAVAEFQKADAEYKFTLTSAGAGRVSLDPEEREAKALATAFVNGKIKASGKTVKEYREANPDKYAQLVSQIMGDDKVKKQAAENVRRSQDAAKSLKTEIVL